VLSNPFRPLLAHARDLWWTHGPFLLVLVFLMPEFIVDTIKVSHRFAGPIFALRRAMREIVQGKPPRKLKFRRKDFWQDLADDYNAMLLRLEILDDEVDQATDEEEQLVGATK
jgi:nitrogen fixation/metabolism regulation signal transduction histidine kinase